MLHALALVIDFMFVLKNITLHQNMEMVNYQRMSSVQIVAHSFKAMRTQSALHLIKKAVKTKTGYR